jgi:hypothetical protein
VRAVVKIEMSQGAWISAAAAGGGALLGSAIIWPIMRRFLSRYDAKQVASGAVSKDVEGNIIVDAAGAQRFQDVEEDKCVRCAAVCVCAVWCVPLGAGGPAGCCAARSCGVACVVLCLARRRRWHALAQPQVPAVDRH